MLRVPSSLVVLPRIAVFVVLAAVACGGCSVLFSVDGYQGLEAGLLQQATEAGTDTRQLIVSLPEPTSGDALIVIAASVNSAPEVTGGGVTWKEQSTSSMHVVLAVWAAFGQPKGSSELITVSWPAAQLRAVVHVSEWVGPKGFGGAAKMGGTGGPVTTGNIIVGDDAALVLAAAGTHGAQLGMPENGFVALELASIDDTQLPAAYVASPPAGSYATGWSYGGTNSWDAHVVSFVE